MIEGTAMDSDTLARGEKTGPWCSRCGLPVAVEGEPELGRAVHAATGREQGNGGHFAAPIEYETAIMRGARRLRREYDGILNVALVYGAVIRVTFPDPADRRCFEGASAGAVQRAADGALVPGALAVVTGRREDAAARAAVAALR
jgi:hypothetical protein